MGDKRVVWILGSGFSKPLGGPMLTDFFSRSLESRIIAEVKNIGNQAWRDTFASLLRRVRTIYAGGHEEENDVGMVHRRGPWTNAEEFLEYVDMSVVSEHNASARAIVMNALQNTFRFTGHIPTEQNLMQLGDDARIYLAAACHFFVPQPAVIEQSERWSPYRRWGKRLKQSDHVIAFNYDVVPERVAPDLTSFVGQDGADEGWIAAALADGPLLIKVHGSVSRALPLQDGGAPDDVDVWTAVRERRRFEIAGPGPGKFAASQERFKRYWRLARHVIEDADAVVFVGYRIPETDSYACEQLVRAFREHRRKSELNVRIVLGPRRDHDVERLMGLLKWSGCHAQKVFHEPLWSQDFLAAFDRDIL